ncbi:O-antigen polymerase [Inediibacterium massiliense]|uniref:O-antigen polymerase n=1 Tax=Inediibacterium massiliense TaxID=1658111 RepID=UPI0006B50DDD|nr:O-antigen polymerase [Inediibacterium massiliense]
MSILILVSSILMIFLAKIVIRKGIERDLIYIYLIWWGGWSFYSTFNPHEMYKVSSFTYALVLIHMWSFFIGFLIHKRSKIMITEYSVLDLEKSFDRYFINNKTYKIVTTLVLVLLTYYLYRYNLLLSIYGILESRSLRYGVGGVFSTAVEAHCFNYIISAFIYINMSVCAFSTLFKRIKTYSFYVSLMNVLFFSGIGAGRGTIVALLLFFFFAFIAHKNFYQSKKLSFNPKRLIILVASVLIFFSYMMYLTATRMGYKELTYDIFNKVIQSLFSQVGTYVIGAFRALDYVIQGNLFNEDIFWGRATLAWIDQLIGSFLNLFGLNYRVANYYIDNITKQTIRIGANHNHNALYTQILRFYLDFRLVGVILLSCIFGYYFHKTLLNYLKECTIQNMMISMIVFDAVIRGIMNFQLSTPAPILAIIILFLWNKKNKGFKNRRGIYFEKN